MTSMTTTSNTKLEGMLRKVQGLLRKADDPASTPAESQSFRERAEMLMLKYRISEASLAQQPDTGIVPVWSDFDVCSASSEFRQYYRALVDYVISHCGVRGLVDSVKDPETQQRILRCNFVGLESDVHIVQMLYTNCMLAFQSKLEPKVDELLSDQENAYNMRQAGMEGWRIAMALWAKELGAEGQTRWYFVANHENLLYKARRLFKAEALRRGEDPSDLLGQGNNMRLYRESYANGFVSELRYRLVTMRRARGAEAQGVALAGRKERIDAAFYERYPSYAPLKPLPTAAAEKEQEQGEVSVARNHERGTYQDPRERCERCQKAKSGYCREHSYLRPSTASHKERPVHRGGERRGQQAARSIDLGNSSRERRLG